MRSSPSGQINAEWAGNVSKESDNLGLAFFGNVSGRQAVGGYRTEMPACAGLKSAVNEKQGTVGLAVDARGDGVTTVDDQLGYRTIDEEMKRMAPIGTGKFDCGVVDR